MGDPFAKVKPGDKLAIPAPAYNAFIDAAKDYRDRRDVRAATVKPTASSQTAVLVKNTSDVACPRFGVMSIVGPIIHPDDNESAFAEQVMFTATKPSGTGGEPFVVALEPIPIGKIGRAVAAGVAIVSLDVSDAGHNYARLDADNSDGLVSCDRTETGAIPLIWRAGGTGDQYAMIHVGGQAAGVVLLPGKVVSDWAVGNKTSELTPLDDAGAEIPDADHVYCQIVQPGSIAPVYAHLLTDMIVQYIPFTGGTIDGHDVGGLIVGVSQLPPVAGKSQYMVLSLDADAGKPKWDWVRAHA